MKIVMSADYFFPALAGGTAATIYWQAKVLAQTGHEVTVVATSRNIPDSIPLDRWLVREFGRVIYTKNPHFYLPIKHIWYGWQAIRQADVVHVNSLFYPASFVWILSCWLLNKPVVWSPHGELSPAALRIRPYLKRTLLAVFRKWGKGILFHATSSEEANQIRTHLGRNIDVLESRTMMELPPPCVREAQPYLLFMGRLHPIKAIDRLLEALGDSTLFRESNYSLVLAGPDSDKTYTKTLVNLVMTLGLSTKVSFIGVVTGERKEQLYANAYLLILPSHAENFGNVVVESLAQGTPVIASTNTPWQVLDEEGTGCWVANDSGSLRQTIDHFLVMPPNQYEQYRIRARQLACRDYDITANPTRWIDFYETAIRRNLSLSAWIIPSNRYSPTYKK